MTIKELAEFTGKNKSTIGRWIEKLDEIDMLNELQNATSSNPVDFTIDEVERILRAGSMSKDAVNILINNARENNKNAIARIENNNPMTIMMDFMVKMQEQQQQFMNTIIDRLDTKETKQLSLPSAPNIEPRAYLNQLVREYSQLKGVDFRKGWNVLYTEILYRCKTNIKVKSKNEGIKPIDYLERENMLLTACSIMKGLI